MGYYNSILSTLALLADLGGRSLMIVQKGTLYNNPVSFSGSSGLFPARKKLPHSPDLEESFGFL